MYREAIYLPDLSISERHSPPPPPPPPGFHTRPQHYSQSRRTSSLSSYMWGLATEWEKEKADGCREWQHQGSVRQGNYRPGQCLYGEWQIEDLLWHELTLGRVTIADLLVTMSCLFWDKQEKLTGRANRGCATCGAPTVEDRDAAVNGITPVGAKRVIQISITQCRALEITQGITKRWRWHYLCFSTAAMFPMH